MKVVLGLTLLAAADAFATAARRAAPRMGLAVGEPFPPAALASWGVKGKNAVIYFYGADGAPSCTKEAAAFDAAGLGCAVVGVRNEGGVKPGFAEAYPGIRFVVDEGDQVRGELGIAKDFLFLGGRETYVVDKAGTVASVFNAQFAPEKHVEVAGAALDALAPAAGGGGGGFKLPSFFGGSDA